MGIAFPEILVASFRPSRPRALRRARPPRGVNHDPRADGNFQAAADDRGVPAPS